MKKGLFSMVLVLAMVLVLSACGGASRVEPKKQGKSLLMP